uniref:E3 SUMO-protein ligase PIAS2-like isoform X3 n=1 Tax=Myxine glutinosa TaxID=7769 RepID=UPI00358FF962
MKIDSSEIVSRVNRFERTSRMKRRKKDCRGCGSPPRRSGRGCDSSLGTNGTTSCKRSERKRSHGCESSLCTNEMRSRKKRTRKEWRGLLGWNTWLGTNESASLKMHARSFSEACLPSLWKVSLVTPIHKGASTDPLNDSLMPIISKVNMGTVSSSTGELSGVTTSSPNTVPLSFDGGLPVPSSTSSTSPVAMPPLLASGPELDRALSSAMSGSLSRHHVHPVHPDVRLKRLPFYDMLDELVKPSSLVSSTAQRFQETYFVFALTPQQVTQIGSSRDMLPGQKYDYTTQVQLRFCLSETSCPQEDHFPPALCVKVNAKLCPLPGCLPPAKNGVEPKRLSRPINITPYVHLSPTVPNHVTVSWTTDFSRNYSVSVYLVKQLTSASLLQRLKAKGIRNPDHSRALIKEKLTADPDSEIATTSLRVSLMCPLGKMRLSIPCRSLTCTHLQCFDAALYLQMNEKKPTWVCPVCDRKAPYETLIIDGLFMEILNSCSDVDEIQFREDGSWSPMRPKKECQDVVNTSTHYSLDGSSNFDTMCMSGRRSPNSARGGGGGSVSTTGTTTKKQVEVIDLTVESSSDDDSSSNDAASGADDDDDDDDGESERERDEIQTAKKNIPLTRNLSPTLQSRGIVNLHQSVNTVRGLESGFRMPGLAEYQGTFSHPHMSSLPDLQGSGEVEEISPWNEVRQHQHQHQPLLGSLDLYTLLQTDNQQLNMAPPPRTSCTEPCGIWNWSKYDMAHGSPSALQSYGGSGLPSSSLPDEQDPTRSMLSHGFFPYSSATVYLDQLPSQNVGSTTAGDSTTGGTGSLDHLVHSPTGACGPLSVSSSGSLLASPHAFSQTVQNNGFNTPGPPESSHGTVPDIIPLDD